MNQTCWFWHHKHFSLTARTLFPSFSMEQGHQPLTDCWANRDLAWSAFSGLPNSAPFIMSREHFSGVFAGATILRRSSSNVPAQQYHNEMFRYCVGKKEKGKHLKTSRCNSYRGNRPGRICRYPIFEQSVLEGSWTLFCQGSRSSPDR